MRLLLNSDGVDVNPKDERSRTVTHSLNIGATNGCGTNGP